LLAQEGGEAGRIGSSGVEPHARPIIVPEAVERRVAASNRQEPNHRIVHGYS
jgi:hypothetical protein